MSKRTSRESRGNGSSDDQVPGVARSQDTLLRRSDAARMLGVSKSTLRRMEGEHVTPVVGPKNVRLFHEEQIRSLVVTRRAHAASGPASGELAADAFEQFDAGVHPVDVVKKMRVDPAAIESLHQRWLAWRGGLVISPAGAATLHEMLGVEDSSAPPKTEDELLALVRAWVVDASVRHCERCRAHLSAFCRMCARSWGLRAAKRELDSARERHL